MSEARPLAAAARSTELRGILIALVVMFLFSLMDAGSKFLSARYPTVQVLWLRYMFTIPLLLAILAPQGLGRFVRSARPGLQILRSLLLVSEIGLIVWAFGQLPLADVHAIIALAPLIVTAFSVPLLHEPVGARRWAAVALGFLGALVIIRPGLAVIHPAILVALLGVVFYALYQVLTRMVGRVDSAETSFLWQLVVGTLVLSLAVPFAWRMPEPEHWPVFVLVAVLGGAGHYGIIKALQLAPAVVIQPFSYTLLLWAVVIGYVGFGDFPDAWTLAGAGIIVAAGIYAAFRERGRAGA